MSIVPFNDTITLFSPRADGGYERKVIPYVHAEITEGIDARDCSATVYVPIHGKRSLKYFSAAGRTGCERDTFTVKPGQLILPYAASEDSPPEDAMTVAAVSEFLSGSRRIRHVKIRACKIPEQASDKTTDKTDEGTTEEEQGSTNGEVTQ